MEIHDARIDALPLFSGRLGERAGAVFYLESRPKFTAIWERGDGWGARVDPSSRAVIAFGGRSDAYASVWHEAYAVAQEALDVWAFRGLGQLRTEDPFGNHLAFWDDPRGPIVRLVGRSPMTVTIGPVTAIVYDAAGNIVPQPPPPDGWHPSMRFFRQAQASGDLFESLRDLWLAMENLLDDIEPQGTDTEEKWLRRALKTAGGLIDLGGYMPPPNTAQGPAPAFHNAAYSYFYDDLRTHLFHAKTSRQPILPNDVARVRDLALRHSQLSNLYIDLLRAKTGVVRAGGAMTNTAFEMGTDALVSNARVLVTDDLTPFDPADTEAAPGGGIVVGATAAHRPDLEGPGVRVVLAEVPGVELEKLAEVRVGRVVLEANGVCAAAHIPEGELFLPGVACLEAQLEVSLMNASLPRQFSGY